MTPFVKILSSRSAAELTLDVNQYLNTLQERNNKGSFYSVRSVDFRVTPLPDLGVMYTVLIVVDDDSDVEVPF